MNYHRFTSCLLTANNSILFLLLLLSGHFAIAQNCDVEVASLLEKGDSLEKIGRANYFNEKGKIHYKAAFTIFNKALVEKCVGEMGDSLLGEINYKSGRCLLNTERSEEMDSSIIYFRKAAEYYARTPELKARIYPCYTNMGRALHQLNDYQGAEQMFQEGHRNLKYSKTDTTKRGILLLGDFYREWGNLQNKQDKVYEALGKYERAWQLYLSIRRNDYQIRTGISIGAVLNKLNRPQKVLQFLTKLEELIKSDPVNGFWIADCHLEMGLAHKRLGEYDKALEYFDSAAKDSYTRSLALTNKGITHRRAKKFNAAISNLSAAIEIDRSKLATSKVKRIEYAYHLENMGDTYADSTLVDSAIIYFQQALEMLVPGFAPLNERILPDVNRMKPIGSRSRLITILSAKAASLFTRYTQTGDSNDLTAAAATFDLAIDLNDRFRREFQANESRLFLMEEAFSTYEGAIQVAIAQKDPERAFQFAEKAKASLLFAAIQDNEAREYAYISQDLLDQEYELKQQIARLEYELSTKGLDEGENSELALVLNGLNESLSELILEMERSSPAYYQLKYQTNSLDVKQIKQQLPANTSLVEYFAGENTWYVFTVNKASVQVFTVNRDTASIQEYLRLLPQTASLSPEKQARFQVLGYELYQELIGEIAAELGEEIIIVPDGELNYLPFETLLTTHVATNTLYKFYPFWLREKAVSYSFSARLWQHALSREKRSSLDQSTFIAFAPEFAPLTRSELPERDQALLNLSFFSNRAEPESSRPWNDLEYSQTEVQQVKELLGGIIYPNAPLHALLGRFVEESEEYRFVHLATHGIFNKQNGKYSYLAFQPVNDSIDNERLYLADLYRIRLNAEMVVLSACETQVGEWHPGEGIASLAQGFTYAGARSIVATLWSVSNKSHSDLTPRFYRFLREGKTKAHALQLAKLEMVESGNYAAPYHWAAPVILGDTRPVTFFPWALVMTSIGIGLLLIAIGIGYKRRSRQQV